MSSGTHFEKMNELATFFQLGFRHIVARDALDHILFLVALAAIYRVRDLRGLLWVITAFTVGHSLTLALAITGLLTLPTSIIEFLIPVTIVATALENVLMRDWSPSAWGMRYRPLFAGLFGLIHGAGFANYLKAMFVDRIAMPLLGFNVGIEVGQVVVLLAIGASLALIDRILLVIRRPTTGTAPHRVRVLAVSSLVIVFGTRWAFERWPW